MTLSYHQRRAQNRAWREKWIKERDIFYPLHWRGMWLACSGRLVRLHSHTRRPYMPHTELKKYFYRYALDIHDGFPTITLIRSPESNALSMVLRARSKFPHG